MLEDTVEEMSTTFVGLSDSVLGSEHIRSHPQLITSIGDSVKRALTLAENATRDPDGESESVDDDEENPHDQSSHPVQSESASNVPVASSQGGPATAARFLTMNEMGMQDFYMDPPFEAVPSAQAVIRRRRDPVPQNVRGMPTQNTFFTQEFWGGDYATTTNMHMVERPDRPLPFWERLLRLNLTSVIHRLTNDGVRGDADFCTGWEARGFKYSLRHKSKASLLARTRWVIDTIAANDAQVDALERNTVGPSRKQADWRSRIEAYFDNDDLRASGAATMHSMVLANYPVENLVNAEEVESYLKEKGVVEVGENEMQLELTIPAPPPRAVEVDAKDDVNEVSQAPTRTATRSRTSQPNSRPRSDLTRQGRPQKRIVTLSVETLIWKFIDLSICTGNGIGYPKESINSAIVASVTRIGD
jgi:hypothetical protein